MQKRSKIFQLTCRFRYPHPPTTTATRAQVAANAEIPGRRRVVGALVPVVRQVVDYPRCALVHVGRRKPLAARPPPWPSRELRRPSSAKCLKSVAGGSGGTSPHVGQNLGLKLCALRAAPPGRLTRWTHRADSQVSLSQPQQELPLRHRGLAHLLLQAPAFQFMFPLRCNKV